MPHIQKAALFSKLGGCALLLSGGLLFGQSYGFEAPTGAYGQGGMYSNPSPYAGQPQYEPPAPYSPPAQYGAQYAPQAPYDSQPTYAPQQQMPVMPEAGQSLSPAQLDDLVAPIALYPDPLLSEVLAASTYPLEVAEAGQWLQQQGGLQGPQLIAAARKTGWDPSVQALVAFPDALALLNRDLQWTTDLGNAFLARQSDVLAAIQRLRVTAEQNGRLASTPQQTVSEYPAVNPQYGPGPIQIQPVDPQAMYVPSYDPQYVWGPPPGGAWPALGYPASGLGIIFGTATLLGSLFTGLVSWGGWGWGLSWLTHSLLLNGLFLTHFGFGGAGGGYGYPHNYAATTAWTHNPSHRLGVPYADRSVARQFGGSFAARSASFSNYRAGAGQPSGGWRSFGSPASGPRIAAAGTAHSYAQAYGRGSYGPAYAAPHYSGSGYTGSGYGSYQGFRAAPSSSYGRAIAPPAYSSRGGYAQPRSFASTLSPGRSYSERAFTGGSRYSPAPRAESHFSAPHYSAPHSSGGGHVSGHASGHSGGHSSAGHSGGGHRK